MKSPSGSSRRSMAAAGGRWRRRRAPARVCRCGPRHHHAGRKSGQSEEGTKPRPESGRGAERPDVCARIGPRMTVRMKLREALTRLRFIFVTVHTDLIVMARGDDKSLETILVQPFD